MKRQYFYAVMSDKSALLPTTVRCKQGESETQARLTEPWRYSRRRELFRMVRVAVRVEGECDYQPFTENDNEGTIGHGQL